MMDALNKYLDILNTQLDAIECSRMLTDQWDRLLALRGERVGEYNLIDTYID